MLVHVAKKVKQIAKHRVFLINFSSALCYCIDELLSSCVRAIRPSVGPTQKQKKTKTLFLEIPAQINTKLYGKALSNISPENFVLNDILLFCFFVNVRPYKAR